MTSFIARFSRVFSPRQTGGISRLGALGFFGWLWFFARVVRRLGREAKEDDSERGWLLVSAHRSSVLLGARGLLGWL